MLFLEIDPIGPHEPAGLYQAILAEVLQLIDRIAPHDLAPIHTEEVLRLELDHLLITHRIDQVFQGHLLTEDLLHRNLVLPEVIAGLAILQDLQETTEALEVHRDLDPQEMFVVLEVHLDLGPQEVFVARVVPLDPREAYVAQEVPPGLQVAAGLVGDLVGEDNSSN